MKRLLTGLSVLLLTAGLAQAQTGGVRGKALDDKGQPLEGVAVKMEFQGGMNLAFDAKTNKKGEYMQIGLRPGSWKFTYTKEGFQVFTSPARISLGDATVLPDVKLVSGKAAAAGAPVDDIQKLFAEAVAKLQAGDHDGAIAAFDALIVKYPDRPEAHYNKGFAHYQKKDYAGAEAALKRALEIRPEYSDARVLLSSVYTTLGQKEKAVEVMSAGNGGDARQLLALGETLVNNGDWPKATEAFLKAEVIDPKNIDVQYHLGIAALMAGKTEECATRLEKYLSGNPTSEQRKATASGMLAACKKK